jgi:hypothetical protein
MPAKTVGPGAGAFIMAARETPYMAKLAKGYAPTLNVIEKGADASGSARASEVERQEVDPALVKSYLDSLPDEERVLILMKAAQAQPMTLAHRPSPRPGSVLQSLTGSV